MAAARGPGVVQAAALWEVPHKAQVAVQVADLPPGEGREQAVQAQEQAWDAFVQRGELTRARPVPAAALAFKRSGSEHPGQDEGAPLCQAMKKLPFLPKIFPHASVSTGLVAKKR